MKKLMFYAMIAVAFILCFSCENETVNPSNSSVATNLGAEVIPAISTQYSNEEIAEMIRLFSISREVDVIPPAELQQKFRTDFPNAYDIEWEFGADIYEVEFEIRYRDYEVYYDRQGVLLMCITEIMLSELPSVVKNAAQAKYPEYSFEDIDKISRGSEVFYKIEMERFLSDSEVNLLIKSDGVILNETIDY
ncbi:MAG: PepSY-like domain-containing protein [Prevotellaceae bacterium]|jgi:hypothetical protein|nr:PepSY-like domain-containing protein [Prevotellaceae bacterium]